jgi:hypothetical protein
MLSRSHALRLHVESALAGRVAFPFRFQQPQPATASAGIAAIDQLAGGLPRGCLTEIYGTVSSGIASLLQSVLAARTAAAEACALVDAQDSFDPHGAESAGVTLRRLLWVRCRNVDQALRSVDLLLHGGGFSLVAVDLSGAPERFVRQIPLNFWFRLRRTVENTPTILLMLSRQSHAKTCASLVLRVERTSARWSLGNRLYPSPDFYTQSSLLDHWAVRAEMIRSDVRRKKFSFIDRAHHPDNLSVDSVSFALRSQYFLSTSSTDLSPDDSAQNDCLFAERTQNFG